MRNKVVAIVLAFFFGWFGAHKFYLGQTFMAVLYLFFCWTIIPGLLSIFDFIGLLLTSDEDFDQRFNGRKAGLPSRKLQQRLLKVCKEYRGATLSDCIMETGADIEEVQEALNRFAKNGLISVENRPHDGAVIYKTV
ncbi:MAG: TM2 domain-containing protein [Roseofilum sp. SBFL]|uniref:TM2 domain-containing protein n=1 Tax=unclassified Roseofilum TaxID=2620099 RepID=UPI001B14A07A|nr:MULTISPECIES: TM2 domain-containing protein [unclassified Roseofilum]MBP0012130.1 TM2 domain-containing protein [Roseofilum sp. SID3]MBP0023934.1 TM2 domain-containing protein [Roseofilum sp. SID2]MBP0039556.1 TM2 domain-containing protein [Roseofilum sp. SID1]MBP0044464.1 TM2 domain-containing protein [Roseofilum sp. SBFL]